MIRSLVRELSSGGDSNCMSKMARTKRRNIKEFQFLISFNALLGVRQLTHYPPGPRVICELLCSLADSPFWIGGQRPRLTRGVISSENPDHHPHSRIKDLGSLCEPQEKEI